MPVNFCLKYAGRFDAKYAEFGERCAEICSKYAKLQHIYATFSSGISLGFLVNGGNFILKYVGPF